ncbi:hypothetical protein [Thermomonospora umbrina]|uniref:Uncharacterized protein n=1 Tax=Thermomonospora umbrina TaxID=111806 RepID=A0A3D9SRM3_9ACTN|nr:hypothetical protein [Thermomonospora umbrina]REE95264.1 hypothetical protein DFJ69_0647 [Thermomonospora umbrina]
MSHPVLFCSDCGDDRPFERPPCSDGHGVECPELACTVCGSAILLGTDPPALPATPVVSAARAPAGAPSPHGPDPARHRAA